LVFEARNHLTSVHTPHDRFDVDHLPSVIELLCGRALIRTYDPNGF
jgi:hypothetical protein